MRQEQARVTVRNETPQDFAAIGEVVQSAFGKDETADLVDRIRASANYVPDLSFVTEHDGRIVGHVMLSYVDVVDRATTHRALTLSPVSVLPEAQGRGIGGALVEAATQKADEKREPMIILEGSPRYYPRFGFKPAKDFGIEIHLPDWAPEEAAMVKPLTSYRSEIKGKVVYPPAFDVVNVDRH